MYNEKLKTRFIQEYTNSITTSKVCHTIFNAVERYEVKWNADICTQNEQTLQPAIDEIVGLRTKSKWIRLLILKNYVKWCIVTGVPNACDGMLNISIIGLEKIRYQTVASPAHLEKYLNEICEPVEKKTIDNIYRCYYWIAYAGLKEEDIFKVKCSEVDFSEMVIRYEDTEIPIYREAVPAFKNCIELTQFVYNHPLYLSPVWKDRIPGDTIIRGLKAQNPSEQKIDPVKTMRVELSRRSRNRRDSGMTNLKLSYYRVWISGLFYRVYENEQIGIEPDFNVTVLHQLNSQNSETEAEKNFESKKRRLVREYTEDYQRWKLAYKK